MRTGHYGHKCKLAINGQNKQTNGQTTKSSKLSSRTKVKDNLDQIWRNLGEITWREGKLKKKVKKMVNF